MFLWQKNLLRLKKIEGIQRKASGMVLEYEVKIRVYGLKDEEKAGRNYTIIHNSKWFSEDWFEDQDGWKITGSWHTHEIIGENYKLCNMIGESCQIRLFGISLVSPNLQFPNVVIART